MDSNTHAIDTSYIQLYTPPVYPTSVSLSPPPVHTHTHTQVTTSSPATRPTVGSASSASTPTQTCASVCAHSQVGAALLPLLAAVSWLWVARSLTVHSNTAVSEAMSFTCPRHPPYCPSGKGVMKSDGKPRFHKDGKVRGVVPGVPVQPVWTSCTVHWCTAPSHLCGSLPVRHTHSHPATAQPLVPFPHALPAHLPLHGHLDLC